MQPNRDRYGDRDRQSRRQRDRDEGDEDDDGARSKRPKPDPKPDPKPEWETSGALAEETNTYKGRQLKWNEPPDLHKPKEKYRLYMFKDGEQEKVCIWTVRSYPLLPSCVVGLGGVRSLPLFRLCELSCINRHGEDIRNESVRFLFRVQVHAMHA